jgi:hypothetical protein
MKNIIIGVVIIIVFALTFFSLMEWTKNKLTQESINMCGHTIEEANNSIHWDNGIYSPEGCEINNK